MWLMSLGRNPASASCYMKPLRQVLWKPGAQLFTTAGLDMEQVSASNSHHSWRAAPGGR